MQSFSWVTAACHTDQESIGLLSLEVDESLGCPYCAFLCAELAT